jgi:hypothetical protein
LAVILAADDLRPALERQARLVAMAPLVSDAAARVEADRAFEGLAAEIPALLQRFGYGASQLCAIGR